MEKSKKRKPKKKAKKSKEPQMEKHDPTWDMSVDELVNYIEGDSKKKKEEEAKQSKSLTNTP